MREKNMKTIASGKRWHLWISRYQWAWFELWASWDYHNYTLSTTVLTVEIGWEWVWLKSRDNLKKGGRQIMWARVP